MAMQWTRYVITAKHYDSQRNRIESVQVREYSNGRLSDAKVFSRQQVLNLIDSKEKFVTATWSNAQNHWVLGEDVRPVQGKYDRYLRTDNNQTEADNLGNLPEF